MKLNKKIAVAFPAAALAVMGTAGGAAASTNLDDGEDFTVNALNCLALDVLNIPILSDDDNTVDCSKEHEVEKTKFGFMKVINPAGK